MRMRVSVLTAVCLLASAGFAKDKAKNTLPAYVLRAQTVLVIVDLGAGFSIENSQAAQVAIKDVETALLNWGRFDPILERNSADLIIVLHPGTGKLAAETIRDPRQHSRSEQSTPIGDGIPSAASQQGVQIDDPGPGPNGRPNPQEEIGEADDSFAVYQGRVDRPLELPPAWRYVAKDGLRPHDVPAVDAFRKAIANAEKAGAKNP